MEISPGVISECPCENCQAWSRRMNGGQGGGIFVVPEGMMIKEVLEADGIVVTQGHDVE
jgi:hypothetical protein